MPPDLGSAQIPDEWLRRAKGNLARAKQSKPAEGFWEDLCFDAQQAAEKAVKAVLVFRQIDFPKTHQIGELLVLLGQGGHGAPEPVWRAQALSNYAVSTRYPSPEEPVTEDEWREAVELAEQVVRWAESVIRAA
jgi:HEPN domain-containing protein